MILLVSLFFEAVVRNGIVALRKEEAKQIVKLKLMISCHGLQLKKYGVVQVTIASDASFHQRLPLVPSAKHFILIG